LSFGGVFFPRFVVEEESTCRVVGEASGRKTSLPLLLHHVPALPPYGNSRTFSFIPESALPISSLLEMNSFQKLSPRPQPAWTPSLEGPPFAVRSFSSPLVVRMILRGPPSLVFSRTPFLPFLFLPSLRDGEDQPPDGRLEDAVSFPNGLLSPFPLVPHSLPI